MIIGIGVLACTREISCTGAEATLHVMSRIGTDASRFSTGDALFEATSLVSSASESQKNEYSEVTLLASSVSGFQKKEKSETVFGHRDTGDKAIFVEDVTIGDEVAIRSEVTC